MGEIDEHGWREVLRRSQRAAERFAQILRSRKRDDEEEEEEEWIRVWE